MELRSLGYVGIRSPDVAGWDALTTNILGMQSVDSGGGSHMYRMDDRVHRFMVDKAAQDGLGFIGWEVGSPRDLQTLGARLDAANIPVEWASPALCAQRHVAAMIVFHDPVGTRLEAFWSAEVDTAPFVPGRPLSGFRTGSLGMGHVVMHVRDVDTLLPFYCDLLGFRVTDYGVTPYKLYFFHLNGRHHSFAMVGSGKSGFHHFMIEMASLDDVGQAYDLAQQSPGLVAYTLGRHLNDQVTSFYVNTPSGFFVEYGWGGQIIDPAVWQPHETFGGPSLWGHDRLYEMPPGQRENLLAMRLQAARDGLRAPNPIVGSE